MAGDEPPPVVTNAKRGAALAAVVLLFIAGVTLAFRPVIQDGDTIAIRCSLERCENRHTTSLRCGKAHPSHASDASPAPPQERPHGKVPRARFRRQAACFGCDVFASGGAFPTGRADKDDGRHLQEAAGRSAEGARQARLRLHRRDGRARLWPLLPQLGERVPPAVVSCCPDMHTGLTRATHHCGVPTPGGGLVPHDVSPRTAPLRSLSPTSL